MKLSPRATINTFGAIMFNNDSLVTHLASCFFFSPAQGLHCMLFSLPVTLLAASSPIQAPKLKSTLAIGKRTGSISFTEMSPKLCSVKMKMMRSSMGSIEKYL